MGADSAESARLHCVALPACNSNCNVAVAHDRACASQHFRDIMRGLHCCRGSKTRNHKSSKAQTSRQKKLARNFSAYRNWPSIFTLYRVYIIPLYILNKSNPQLSLNPRSLVLNTWCASRVVACTRRTRRSMRATGVAVGQYCGKEGRCACVCCRSFVTQV